MSHQAGDINPELKIRGFADGVSLQNLDDFLEGVDIYIDGLDFFAFQARQEVFRACELKGIPAVTAAPLGMGAAVLNFLPGGMSFDDYFRLNDGPESEKPLRFLMGLAPARLQMSYLVDPSAVDLSRQKGPSTIMACQLCAGVAATEALKILLGRGTALAAPTGYHFDAYWNKLASTWRPGGNRNPLQRLAIAIARRKLGI
jgi:molybdopterin/thiamine biosynthesis adenylyltransferase